MKAIFNRTMSLMFKPVVVILYFLFNIITMVVAGQFLASQFTNFKYLILQQQSVTILMSYCIIVFWLAGMLILLLISGVGTGIFSSEEADGTMRILLSKQILRRDMIFGKILGLLAGCSIYLITSLVISVTVLVCTTPLDVVVYNHILPLLPIFIIYGLFIIFVFCSIASLLSSLIKKSIVSLMIMLVITIAIFVGIPMLRLSGISDLYETYHLYLFDMNYHFGQIFTSLVKIMNDFSFSHEQKVLIGNVLGTFKLVKFDFDIVKDIPKDMIESNYLNGYLLSIFYIVMSSGFFSLAFIRMNKKDIN